MPNINDKIRQFLDDLPDVAGFSKDDARYISQYTGCSVPEHAIIVQCQEMIKEKFPFIHLDFPTGTGHKALCYGYGSDRVLSNTKAVITSYQEDYYCYRVTQAVHYDKVVTGDHSVVFRNLADYFTNYKGNNLKYDIVVVFPHSTEYHRIDTNKAFAELNSFIYYTLRAEHFLKEGGILISVIPKIFEKTIKNLSPLELTPVSHFVPMQFSVKESGEYAIIKLTK